MNSICISIDQRLYRLSAIKKAAYRFGDRCSVEISQSTEQQVVVTLRPKTDSILSADLEGEFRNEVLDQELREVVAEETLPVRNLLLAQAFSATSLLDSVGETADYRDDPLQIRDSCDGHIH